MDFNQLSKKVISTLMVLVFVITMTITISPELARAEVDLSKINCNIAEAKIEGDTVTVKCQTESGNTFDHIVKIAGTITSVSAAMASAGDIVTTLGAGITAASSAVSGVAAGATATGGAIVGVATAGIHTVGVVGAAAGATVASIALPVIGVATVAGGGYFVYKKLSKSEKKSE